jgi:hypothetical protein
MTTTNPWTGKPERFETALNARAFREWERDRVRISQMGYPDRPPETDSTTLWGWDTSDEQSGTAATLRGLGRRLLMAPDAIFHGFWTTSGRPDAFASVVKGARSWLVDFFIADADRVKVVYHDLIQLSDDTFDGAAIDELCVRLLSEVSSGRTYWVSCEELNGEAGLTFRESIDRMERRVAARTTPGRGEGVSQTVA